MPDLKIRGAQLAISGGVARISKPDGTGNVPMVPTVLMNYKVDEDPVPDVTSKWNEIVRSTPQVRIMFRFARYIFKRLGWDNFEPQPGCENHKLPANDFMQEDANMSGSCALLYDVFGMTAESWKYFAHLVSKGTDARALRIQCRSTDHNNQVQLSDIQPWVGSTKVTFQTHPTVPANSPIYQIDIYMLKY